MTERRSTPADGVDSRTVTRRRPRGPSCGLSEESSNSQQVVGSTEHVGRELVAMEPLEPGLAEVADRLHPAEDLLDPLSEPLADRIARVPSRARVDGRVPLLPCDVGRDVARAATLHEVACVVTLVSCD